ncbi:putative sugar nucleotidyl transferase [Candidatus Neomarinimicrobiota bacterium]
MIYLFEDSCALELEPLSLTRATFELRCGVFTQLERVRMLVGNESLALVVRPELQTIVEERYPALSVNPAALEDGIWLNGAALWDDKSLEAIRHAKTVFAAEDRFMGGFRTAEEGRALTQAPVEDFRDVHTSVGGPPLLPHLWDFCLRNGRQIAVDFKRWFPRQNNHVLPVDVRLVGDGGLHLADGVVLDPFVVLDSRNGPIILAEGATLHAHSVVIGPCYIGPRSTVWPGAVVTGSSLGPVCRVGGEVKHTIIQGHANKQHGGFLGHSYLGSWSNLAAGCNNSNLKNNYHPVKVTVNGRVVDSGESAVGLYMGDHAKAAIGTQFDTGSRVGVAANVFGDPNPPKVIPSFAWGIHPSGRYALDKCLDTMEIVKDRRGEILTRTERELYTTLYSQIS